MASEFWSSVELTGIQTHSLTLATGIPVLEQCRTDWYSNPDYRNSWDMPFWSSVELTGIQTTSAPCRACARFWSSVELTGIQTGNRAIHDFKRFWSSVELTGIQTSLGGEVLPESFGAVSN